MKTIHAIYENGVFRPTEAVELPPGTKVVIETEAVAEERIQAARRRVHEILGRSYDTNEPSDILESHNDHQAPSKTNLNQILTMARTLSAKTPRSREEIDRELEIMREEADQELRYLEELRDNLIQAKV